MAAAYLAAGICGFFRHAPLARRGAATFNIAGGILSIAAALNVILSGTPVSFTLVPGALLFPLSFRLDGLGAVFLLLTGILSIPCAIYAEGYYGRGRHGATATTAVLSALFVLAMSLVVCADDVLTFLLLWESMSLISYFLILCENQSDETVSAGAWYAGMAHLGFALIASALFLMGGGTALQNFGAIRAASPSFSPDLKNTVFILALLGFGSKAGLVPLHVWLPKAHPAAPSPVSAMMSGVMVKLGIYGILRVSMDLLGAPSAWWGGLVLGLGAISALLGVLYALMQHDLKRLLAYHTVENVGLISMGAGLALMFRSYGLGALAALALVAALYHTLNHGTFKGLLFLGAGSVYHATGTRNMEEMGGLIRGMPVTAACFLVGAAAISGLPPLNGFVSEWLLFQSLIAGVKIPAALAHSMMALAIGALALTAGLAAACFVKAFGISFLAIPRSKEAGAAREAPVTMRFGMLFLVAICILLGVLPFLMTTFLSRAVSGLPGVEASVRFNLGLILEGPGQAARISPSAIALLLVAVCSAIPFVLRFAGPGRGRRFGESWGCGRIGQSPRMEYTSSAFAEPLRRVFGALYQPTQDVMIDYHPESKYFFQSIQYRSEVRTWFEGTLYRPILNLTLRIGRTGRWIQSGSIHGYVGYILLALLVFLLLARWL